MGISGKNYKTTARNSLAVGQIIGTVSRKDEQNITVKHLETLHSQMVNWQPVRQTSRLEGSAGKLRCKVAIIILLMDKS